MANIDITKAVIRNIDTFIEKYPSYNHIIRRMGDNRAYFILSSKSPLDEFDYDGYDFSEMGYPEFDTDFENLEIINAKIPHIFTDPTKKDSKIISINGALH